MKITPHELAEIRGLIYELDNAIPKAAGTNALLMRRVRDQLKFNLSFLEQPFPHDEPLRNALIMLFMSMVEDDDGFIPKDRELYRSAMRRIHELTKDEH